MTKELWTKAMLLKVLLLAASVSSILAADPCFDNGPDQETGNYAICIPESSCITAPVATNACPSYPSSYACCYHKTFPGREHRGAWTATVANIDWPKSPTSSVATQQTELRHIIDQMADSGFNAIYFQVRPAGDALYQSAIEPWSVYLTGQQGRAPSPLWDPLQFVIDYCRPLNIEVHAWINPYRASLSPTTAGLAPNHMAIQLPQFAYRYDTLLWMDPGSEAVQNRTYSVALDLVTRYDLDGLHMDDYFYPYPVSGWTFPDTATYNAYLQNGGTMNHDDWRRDNVNKLIRRLNDGLHEAKPWIKFSVSPFGIFRAGHPEGMPPPIAGFDQYSEIYCDAKLWLQQGWLDILQPQLYWRIDPPAQSYPILLDWWVASTQNPKGRHVYAGNYLSRIDIDDWPIDEIRNQVDISREPANRLRGSWGNVMFSVKMIRDNTKNIASFFKYFIHPYPAFQPEMSWLTNSTYSQIKELRPSVFVEKGGLVRIAVSAENKIDVITGLFHKIGIYKLMDTDEYKLHKIVPVDDVSSIMDIAELPQGSYAASFLNRFGQEGRKTFFEI